MRKTIAVIVTAIVITAGGGTAVANASDYIGYDSLKRNTTPCSVKSQANNNCRPGDKAGEYNRGCSPAAKCRNDENS